MKTEMSEEMADFWAEVRQLLPGLLKKEGFLAAVPMGDPDEVEIFTVWRGGKEEHIATLLCNTAGTFNLFVDTPGADDGRFFGDVNPVDAVVIIETEVADQVRKHLPGSERGVWTAGYPFKWGGTVVATFEDGDDKGANLTEFVEYARRQTDKALFREAMMATVGLLMREDVSFMVTTLPLYGLGTITLADRIVRLNTNNGRTEVAMTNLDGAHKGSVDITMGPGGVSYPYLTMEGLIREATGRGR